MRRRDFLLGAIMLATARPAPAQQSSARVQRVAMFHPAMKPTDMRLGGDPTYAVIFEEMKRLGRVEGINLIVGRFSADGNFAHFPEIAHAIVATRPDVILILGPPAL